MGLNIKNWLSKSEYIDVCDKYAEGDLVTIYIDGIPKNGRLTKISDVYFLVKDD